LKCLVGFKTVSQLTTDTLQHTLPHCPTLHIQSSQVIAVLNAVPWNVAVLLLVSCRWCTLSLECGVESTDFTCWWQSAVPYSIEF